MKNKFKLMLAGGMALAMAIPGAALADSIVLKASLNGANETHGGDTDGSGSFSAEIDTDTGDVCYTLAVEKIQEAKAAHIHEGAAGKDGKPVHAIDVTGPDDDLCIALEPDKLKEIVAAPWDFYVNVHTADFPAGAIRGQLVGPDGKTGPDPAPAAATADGAAPGDTGSSGDDAGGASEDGGDDSSE